MPTTQTIAPPPPFNVDKQIGGTTPFGTWMQMLQQLNPLRLIDTSAGGFSESVPPPSSNTGISNQNQEITYKKISSDGNTFTLLGGSTFPEGPLTLTTQYSHFEIKSDGNKWYVVG